MDQYEPAGSIANYVPEARYTDENVTPGEEYYYIIRVNTRKWGYSEESTKFESGRVPVPVSRGIEAVWSDQEPQSITITWSPPADVD